MDKVDIEATGTVSGKTYRAEVENRGGGGMNVDTAFTIDNWHGRTTLRLRGEAELLELAALVRAAHHALGGGAAFSDDADPLRAMSFQRPKRWRRLGS